MGTVAVLLFVSGGATFAEAPMIIGEHIKDVVLETPHPYPSAPGLQAARVWTDHYFHPDAKYLVFQFAEFDLAPGDWIEVRDPSGQQVHVYSGKGFKDKGGDFISKMILGPEAYIDLYSRNPGNDHYGYRIDRITRGYSDLELGAMYGGPEAICGVDDKEDAACYEATFPDVYDHARSVVRIVMDGSALCTGWLVSCENHLITNNHCTWDDSDFDTQGELDRMEFQFMYEDASCGGGGASVEYSFMGGTWLEHDHDLDYTLIQAPAGENPAATYGWLLIDYRLADIDETMYIVGHPSGRPKEISLYSSHTSDQDNPDGFCEVYSTDEPVCVGGSVPEIGYFCDTEGGNSGSPVLSRETNKVIALHHCANCPNRGLRIQNIWDMNQAGANPLPACSLFADIGTVELDRPLYSCSDTMTIEVNDGSIAGAGTQSVEVWSDTEPTPESALLGEYPAGSGTFIGGMATTDAAPVNGDAAVSVADGDTVTVRYIDADDGQGGVNVPRLATGTVDCQPPVISNIAVESVTGMSATIVWDTDEDADSEVSYAIVPPAWSTAADPALVTAHSVTVGGLSECTPYVFSVASADGAGNATADDNGGAYYAFETGVNVQPTYGATDLPKPITDLTSTLSTISVPDNETVLDVEVTLDLTHTYDGDLDIFLMGPNAVEIALSQDNGGSGDDYAGTIFDDEAAVDITAGTAPFTGRFRPQTPLSTFDGLNAAGDWRLRVYDDAGQDTGTLLSWSLTLTYPAQQCGPGASYESHAGTGESCSTGGGTNGLWDAGEQVTFEVTLANTGNEALSNVHAFVTPLTPGAAMVVGAADYPDIPIATSAPSLAPGFTVQLSESLACGGTASFQVDIVSDQGAWTGMFDQVLGEVLPPSGTALDESFNTITVPTGWTVVDGGSTTDTWYSDSLADPQSCSNPLPLGPFSTRWMTIDSDCLANNVDLDEALVSPAMDLSGAETVLLEFDHLLQYNADELVEVDVLSSLTGGTWVNVGSWSANTTNPQHEAIDITSQAAGAGDVQVRWHYYNARRDLSWQVDNAKVTYTTPGCVMAQCLPAGVPGVQTGSWWPDPSTFAWALDPLATYGYTLYRGTAADLSALLTPDADSCLRWNGADAGENQTALGGDDPAAAAGGLYWYLVTGWNSAGEGGVGNATAGPRQHDSTGACP
jgi:subtilisin-like proprotein convertase family protein